VAPSFPGKKRRIEIKLYAPERREKKAFLRKKKKWNHAKPRHAVLRAEKPALLSRKGGGRVPRRLSVAKGKRVSPSQGKKRSKAPGGERDACEDIRGKKEGKKRGEPFLFAQRKKIKPSRDSRLAEKGGGRGIVFSKRFSA